jgi:hypothetical protein
MRKGVTEYRTLEGGEKCRVHHPTPCHVNHLKCQAHCGKLARVTGLEGTRVVCPPLMRSSGLNAKTKPDLDSKKPGIHVNYY